MKRIFVAQGLPAGQPAQITLGRDTAHYMFDVLRARPGDEFELFDATGRACHVVVEASARRTGLRVEAWKRVEAQEAGGPRIEVAAAVLRGPRWDWMIEKLAELGVEAIVPLTTRRVTVRLDARRAQGRLERWRRIVGEAARQSGRLRPPTVRPLVALDEWLAALPSGASREQGRVLLWERCGSSSLARHVAQTRVGHWMLLVGPEGGWAPEEAAAAQAAGFLPHGLGSCILRAETAGIVAVATLRAALAIQSGRGS